MAATKTDPFADLAKGPDPFAAKDWTGPPEPPLRKRIFGSGMAKFGANVIGGGLGAAGGAGLGATAGTALGPIGTVGGAVAGGMVGAGVGSGVAEGAREALAGEQLNPREIAGTAGMSAALEPVSMLMGGVPAPAAAKLLPKVLGEGLIPAGARAMKLALTGPSKELVARYPGVPEVLSKVVPGPIGSRSIKRQLAQSATNHDLLVKAATLAKAKASPVQLVQPMNDAIAELERAGSPAVDRLVQLRNRFLARKSSSISPLKPVIPANTVNFIKKAAQQKANKLFAKNATKVAAEEGGLKVTEMTPLEAYHYTLAKGAQNWLESLPHQMPDGRTLGQAIHAQNQVTRDLIGARTAMRTRSGARLVSSVLGAGSTYGAGNALGLSGLHHIWQVPFGVVLGGAVEPGVTTLLGGAAHLGGNPYAAALIRQLPRAAWAGMQPPPEAP